MKRTISILLAMGMVVGILSGCGGDAVTQEGADTLVQQTEEPQIQMDETDGSDDMVTLPDLTESHPIANPPCVMVDGILYQDTGFVDSMVGYIAINIFFIILYSIKLIFYFDKFIK